MRPSRFVLRALVASAAPGLAHVPPLQLPAMSPKAAVGQKVGLNDVAVTLAREKLRRSFLIEVGTKTALLEKKRDAKAAAGLRAKAMTLATEAELNQCGLQLLGQKKVDEAIRVFEKSTKDHPESWNAWASLAEAGATAGSRKKAVANHEKALLMTEDEEQTKRIRGEIAKLKT